MLSGREWTVERGRVEVGRSVAMVVMVLVEYIEDFVGERLMFSAETSGSTGS